MTERQQNRAGHIAALFWRQRRRRIFRRNTVVAGVKILDDEFKMQDAIRKQQQENGDEQHGFRRRGDGMKTVRIVKDGETIATVWHAKGYFARLRGLLGRTLQKDGGLLLTPCSAIHTIGMRYAIDAVYLDRNGRVLRIDESLNPGRILPQQRGARRVLELPDGCAKRRAITAGDVLEVVQ
jgi:uncharacterized membrane protein (UPF0127 family)